MSRVYEIIRSKRAVRRFQDRPIPEAMIHQILNAGRLSGSAKNMQPWHFIAVTRPEARSALSRCGAYAAHLAGAPLVVALATRDPYLRLTVPFDLGRAAQNMMLAAWAAGIGSEMATIFRSDVACEILGVPADYAIPWCMSFGFPIEGESRPPRKAGRKLPDEVFHFEQW